MVGVISLPEGAPKITFWTNQNSFYCHTVDIALRALGLPFHEVHIDLSQPKDPEFHKINPRGLVPAIRYSSPVMKEVVIIESSVITQFLADLHPPLLLPPSSESPEAALTRAGVTFFVETWNEKILPFQRSTFRIADAEEKKTKCEEWAVTVEKEIEPYLRGADPFFNGSKHLTLVEVKIAPLLIRIDSLCDGEILPYSLRTSLNKLPAYSRWSNAIFASEIVTANFSAAATRAQAKKRILAAAA